MCVRVQATDEEKSAIAEGYPNKRLSSFIEDLVSFISSKSLNSVVNWTVNMSMWILLLLLLLFLMWWGSLQGSTKGIKPKGKPNQTKPITMNWSMWTLNWLALLIRYTHLLNDFRAIRSPCWCSHILFIQNLMKSRLHNAYITIHNYFRALFRLYWNKSVRTSMRQMCKNGEDYRGFRGKLYHCVGRFHFYSGDLCIRTQCSLRSWVRERERGRNYRPMKQDWLHSGFYFKIFAWGENRHWSKIGKTK